MGGSTEMERAIHTEILNKSTIYAYLELWFEKRTYTFHAKLINIFSTCFLRSGLVTIRSTNFNVRHNTMIHAIFGLRFEQDTYQLHAKLFSNV